MRKLGALYFAKITWRVMRNYIERGICIMTKEARKTIIKALVYMEIFIVMIITNLVMAMIDPFKELMFFIFETLVTFAIYSSIITKEIES